MNFSILTENFDMYMDGFLHTLLASFIALAGSFALGVLIAVMRITAFKPLQWIGTAYVEFIRNIPLLLITFVFYFGLPNAGLRLDGFQAGTIALTIYTSAFIAEAIRAGIQTVSKGQMEAARSSGFTYSQAMRYIILPQAVKIVIPPLGNQFLNLVKNSSILGVVAGLDLMYQADLVSSSTLVVFDVYIFAALFYLIVTIPLSIGVHYLERRLGKSY
ncbi:amino acid ABC transporter permease [Bacillus sp. ICE1]|uniref:amino acid ABC transporter permease n=1 Tax=Bacillus TaxID=1386 RepID=UPI001E5676A7|nr:MULTISPECIES: amino acid ABC transporter permease [unclassified Bacillus (in: firmicutes)]MCC8302789.1 amino acid ABC transporter permease [Bacillus sp. AF12]MDV9078394.1 amino acid ABC transporter permease [Bacillus sp. ICE1]